MSFLKKIRSHYDAARFSKNKKKATPLKVEQLETLPAKWTAAAIQFWRIRAHLITWIFENAQQSSENVCLAKVQSNHDSSVQSI